jgi:polyribonucleotide nucleotidyltransferase
MAEDKLENESTEAEIVSVVEETVADTVEKVEEVAEAPVTEEAVIEEPKEEKKKPAKSKKAVENAIVSDSVEEKEDDDIDALLDKLIAEEVNAGNIIGSLSADKVGPVAIDADAAKVAVFSTRNASWGGYGSVYKGYNILSKRRADAWLTRSHVRLATPAEVAQHLR